jgi:hypothetical protein
MVPAGVAATTSLIAQLRSGSDAGRAHWRATCVLFFVIGSVLRGARQAIAGEIERPDR